MQWLPCMKKKIQTCCHGPQRHCTVWLLYLPVQPHFIPQTPGMLQPYWSSLDFWNLSTPLLPVICLECISPSPCCGWCTLSALNSNDLSPEEYCKIGPPVVYFHSSYNNLKCSCWFIWLFIFICLLLFSIPSQPYKHRESYLTTIFSTFCMVPNCIGNGMLGKSEYSKIHHLP